MKPTVGAALVLLAQTGCSVFGVHREESPKFEVLMKSGNKEIRRYAPYIAATTVVKGTFEESMNPAFRILAGYIFGANEKQQKISMTAPVVANPASEKIAMTAPVIQSEAADGWEMSFMMPSKYKLEDLPRPKDPRVKLVNVPGRTIAVIQYTGLWSEDKNRKQAGELEKWLAGAGRYQAVSSPKFAGYDPPWTLPFLRKNEMMIEVRER